MAPTLAPAVCADHTQVITPLIVFKTILFANIEYTGMKMVESALRDIIANRFLQIAVVRNTNNSDSLAFLAPAVCADHTQVVTPLVVFKTTPFANIGYAGI